MIHIHKEGREDVLTRREKEKVVTDCREKFDRADVAFVAQYRGIKVNEMTRIRRQLREAGAELKVLRNTLVSLSVKGTSYEALGGYFNGPTAITFVYPDKKGDAAVAAKLLTRFAADQPNIVIVAGVFKSLKKVIGIDDIKTLSELPSRDELMGKFLGVLKNIPGQIVSVMGAVPRKFLYALNAVKDDKGAG